MSRPQIIRTEGGDELVVLSRAEYDALLAAAGDLEAESRSVARIVAQGDAALARGDEILLPGWLAVPVTRGEPALKVIRKHLRRSREEVAVAAGISAGHLGELERQSRTADADLLGRLAAALSVDERWLHL